MITPITCIYSKNHRTGDYVTINKIPYYKALKRNSKDIFYKYLKYSKYQSKKDSGDWDKFNKIYKTIKEEGFDFNNKDRVTFHEKNGKLICIRGRHRICMLLSIYGENLFLLIENNKLVNIC